MIVQMKGISIGLLFSLNQMPRFQQPARASGSL